MYYMCWTCVLHLYLDMSYTCIATHVIHLKHHTCITGVEQLTTYMCGEEGQRKVKYPMSL